MRVVLDTNVLVSALAFGGNPREILEKTIRGELMLCLSEEILSELRDVLQRPKFGFPATIVNQIVAELAAIAELIVPSKKISAIKVDPTDNRALECALKARAAYIVSESSQACIRAVFFLERPHLFRAKEGLSKAYCLSMYCVRDRDINVRYRQVRYIG